MGRFIRRPDLVIRNRSKKHRMAVRNSRLGKTIEEIIRIGNSKKKPRKYRCRIDKNGKVIWWSKGIRTNRSWNRGLTKHDHPGIMSQSIKISGINHPVNRMDRPFPPHPRYHIGYRKDLKHSVRSGWEANIERFFNWLGFEVVYELWPVYLGELTYIPDFWLPEINLWVEVKGITTKKEIRKARLFRKLTKQKLMIIDKDAYKDIKVRFSKEVQNWEGRKI